MLSVEGSVQFLTVYGQGFKSIAVKSGISRKRCPLAKHKTPTLCCISSGHYPKPRAYLRFVPQPSRFGRDRGFGNFSMD